jgi:hypothetical protein
MVNERLDHALAKIEAAVSRIDEANRAGTIATSADSPAGTQTAEQDQALASLRNELDSRDRTIAKLRADLVDIGRLKDEEIARLRSELAALGDAAPAGGEQVAFQALERKYEKLARAAEGTLKGLDQLIAKTEAPDHG